MNVQNAIRQLRSGQCVAVIWSTEDVQSLRPDLDAKQSLEVLHQCVDHHDAEFGINWEALTLHAQQLFPLVEA